MAYTPPVTSHTHAHDSTERIALKIEPLDTRHVIRFELDDAILDVIRTVLPTVGGIAPFLTSLENKFMATIAEFKAAVLQKIADNQAASASEHTQVLAAFQALKDQIGGIVSDADVAEVNAAFDAAATGVANIFEPDAPAAVAARADRHPH